MKAIAKLVLLLALGAASVSPAAAAPICLSTYYIDSTHVVNAKTILFRMKNGTVWRNTLRVPCSGLLFNGFSYTVHYPELCDDLQSIRVLQTHEVCVLGKFDVPSGQRGNG